MMKTIIMSLHPSFLERRRNEDLDQDRWENDPDRCLGPPSG